PRVVPRRRQRDRARRATLGRALIERVLVTGATGFLGGALLRGLQTAGYRVRALVRRTSDTQTLDAMGVERVVGDFGDPDSLDAAIDNVDAVIHAAGGGRAVEQADFNRNNLDTTVALLDAVLRRDTPIERFVFVSSQTAQGPSSQARPVDNPSPAPVSRYGRAKRAAERVLTEHD